MARWNPSKAAARGAEWLDKHDPGWATATEPGYSIDVDVLDLGHCERCVLGQRFAAMGSNTAEELSGFDYAVFNSKALFGVDLEDYGNHSLSRLGFTVPDSVSDAHYDRFWLQLTTAWREEVLKRRQRVSAS